jgi:hypothetical protein
VYGSNCEAFCREDASKTILFLNKKVRSEVKSNHDFQGRNIIRQFMGWQLAVAMGTIFACSMFYWCWERTMTFRLKRVIQDRRALF